MSPGNASERARPAARKPRQGPDPCEPKREGDAFGTLPVTPARHEEGDFTSSVRPGRCELGWASGDAVTCEEHPVVDGRGSSATLAGGGGPRIATCFYCTPGSLECQQVSPGSREGSS